MDIYSIFAIFCIDYQLIDVNFFGEGICLFVGWAAGQIKYCIMHRITHFMMEIRFKTLIRSHNHSHTMIAIVI